MITPAMVIDAIFACILIICIIVAWKQGFVQTLLSFIGFIGAAVVAAYSCGRVADYIYKNIVEQPLYNAILKKVLTLVPTGDIISNVENIGDVLPDFVQVLFGNAAARANESIGQTLAGTSEMVAKTVLDTFVGPLVLALLNLILFFVLFALLMVIVKILVSLVGRIFELPVLSGINHFLGGIFGLLNGVLLCFIASALIALYINITADAGGAVNTQVVGSTYIASVFARYNPLVPYLA